MLDETGLDSRAVIALVALLAALVALWVIVRVVGRSKVARIDAAEREADLRMDQRYEDWLEHTLEVLRSKRETLARTQKPPSVRIKADEMRFAVRAVADKVLAWEGDRLKLGKRSKDG